MEWIRRPRPIRSKFSLSVLYILTCKMAAYSPAADVNEATHRALRSNELHPLSSSQLCILAIWNVKNVARIVTRSILIPIVLVCSAAVRECQSLGASAVETYSPTVPEAGIPSSGYGRAGFRWDLPPRLVDSNVSLCPFMVKGFLCLFLLQAHPSCGTRTLYDLV